MATRTYVASEALTDGSANTTATYADQLSLTIPNADASSSTWAVFFSAMHRQSTNTTSESQARFYHDTAATVMQESRVEPDSTGSSPERWFPLSGCIPFTFGSSPGDQVFKLQYANETGSASVVMRDAVMFAIKLDANDASSSSTGSSTSTSTSWTDKVSFTAPSNGTYDIFLCSEIRDSTNLDRPGWRILLEDGSTVVYNAFSSAYLVKDSDDFISVAATVRRTMTTGQTVKLQFSRITGGGGGTITCQRAHAVGFRIDGFDNTYNAQDDTSRTTTSTTYVTRNAASTLTFTPAAAVDHFLFGSIYIYGAVGTIRHARSMMVGTEYQEAKSGNSVSAEFAFLGLRYYANMPAASSTLDWEIIGNASVATSPNARMGAWQLEPGSVAHTAAASLVEDSTLTVAASVTFGPSDPLAELVDDFSGSLATNWTVGSSGATIVSAHLDLPYSSGVTKTIASTLRYAATNSRILAEVSDVPATGQVGMRLIDDADATNYVDLFVQNGDLKARVSNSGTVTTTLIRAYGEVTDAWWQIAEAAGLFLLYTSPNGIDSEWVPVASLSHSWNADNVKAEFWTIGA